MTSALIIRSDNEKIADSPLVHTVSFLKTSFSLDLIILFFFLLVIFQRNLTTETKAYLTESHVVENGIQNPFI